MIRRKFSSSRGDWHSLHKSANRGLRRLEPRGPDALILGAADAAQPVLEVRRVLHDLGEADDGHRVVERDFTVVDLLEEVHELLRPAELGVVVLDVTRREVLDALDLHVVDHGVEELLTWRVLVTDGDEHDLVLAVLVPLVAQANGGGLATALHLVGKYRGVEVEDLHGAAD